VCIGSGSGAGDVLGAAGASRDIVGRYPGFVWYTAGVHPHDAIGFDGARHLPEIVEHIQSGAVAIGECGLDYHYDNSPREDQRATFAAQLEIAASTNRPVVVHTRDAEPDTRAMIVEAGNAGVTGVMHCYTGSHELAEAALGAGWYISFSGIVTFRKWVDDDLIRLVPSDRILVESDAPYLAPVPNRGKRNEPVWVTHTLQKLAATRGVSIAAMATVTSQNARTLFKLA